MKELNATKFTPDNIEGFRQYQLPTQLRFAKQMNQKFFIRNGQGVKCVGEPGDFLLVDWQGNKRICKKDIFLNSFVINENEYSENPQQLKRIFDNSPIPRVLPNDSFVFVSKLMVMDSDDPAQAIVDLEKGCWPEHIELTLERADGTKEKCIYDYNYCTEIPVSEKKTPDTVAQLIAEGGFQTHSSDERPMPSFTPDDEEKTDTEF